MVKFGLFVALALCACSGCTMVSLERQTLAQSQTVTDLRYQEDLANLAMIAHDPSSLPNYSSIFSGTAQLTDMGTVGATTIWQHIGLGATATVGKITTLVGVQNGFGSQALNPMLSRALLENWPLDPVVVPEKLEAMRAAARWVLYGPDMARSDSRELLECPDDVVPGPGRHFNVAKRLAALPHGWLHVGCLQDVPVHARYKTHYEGTWVWVTDDGMEGLADYTCIIQDIARVASNSPDLFNLPAYPAQLTFFSDPTGIYRSRGIQVSAQVSIDPWGRLVPAAPYYKSRLDDEQTDSNLRGQINASGAQP